jgi:tetratricopeptide (TPR) repeat protein
VSAASLHRSRLPLAEIFAVPMAVDPATDKLWLRLERLPYRDQAALVQSDKSFHTARFCMRLAQLSLVGATMNPAIAVELASLAVWISDHLSRFDPRRLYDLRALCLALLGHGRGVLGEAKSAGDAFDEAAAALAAGTGDPAVEAEVVMLEAFLRGSERRFGEAVSLLDRFLDLPPAPKGAAASSGGRGGTVQVLIFKGWCLYHMGEPAACLSLLEEAEGRVADGERGRPMSLAIRTGRVWCALALGDLAMAERTLAAACDLANRHRDRAELLRLRHVEARLRLAQGGREDAEAALRRAASGLAKLKLGSHAALALFDLVTISDGEIKDLIPLGWGEILPTFKGGRVHLVYLVFLLSAIAEDVGFSAEAIEAFGAALAVARPPWLQWWSPWRGPLGGMATDVALPCV